MDVEQRLTSVETKIDGIKDDTAQMRAAILTLARVTVKLETIIEVSTQHRRDINTLFDRLRELENKIAENRGQIIKIVSFASAVWTVIGVLIAVK